MKQDTLSQYREQRLLKTSPNRAATLAPSPGQCRGADTMKLRNRNVGVGLVGIGMLCACSSNHSPGSTPPRTLPVIDLGARQTLLEDGSLGGLSYFPDEGTSVLS